MRQYIALIHKDPDSDYGVSFPDLPGCVTAGVDLDDARRMAEEALALHLAGMSEDKEPIPEPSALETVMADRENRDAVAILVKAPPATAKAVRVNMTMPEDELEQIDKFATEHGYTRSGFLLHAAKRAIGEAEGRKGDPLKELAELVEFRHLGIPAQPASEELWARARALEAVEAKADPTTKAILEALQQLENKLSLRSGETR